MNDKLTLQELIDLLAARHQMEPQDADAFVREFWALIEEGLKSDNYVKIKGLGTFKLIDTEARESINIQTGERIEIQSHARITFTPEASLRDLINRPFGHFETVVLNENTNFDDLEEGNDIQEGEELEEVAPADEEAPAEEVTPAEEVPAEEIHTEDIPVEEAPAEEVLTEEVPTEEIPVEEDAPTEVAVIQATPNEKFSVEEEIPVEKTPEETPKDEPVPVCEVTPEQTESESVVKVIPSEPEEKPALEPTSHKEEKVLEEQKDAPEVDDSELAKATSYCRKSKRRLSWCIVACATLLGIIIGGFASLYMIDIKYNKAITSSNTSSVSQSSAISLETKPELKPEVNLVSESEETLNAAPEEKNEPEVKKEPKISLATDAAEKTQVNAEVKPKKNTQAKPKVNAEAKSDAQTETKPKVKPEVKSESKPVASPKYLSEQVEYKIVGTITTHTLRNGETLTRVALKFYGNKKIWPYLVMHNKDIIKNPDNVPIGTKIKVPKLEPKNPK